MDIKHITPDYAVSPQIDPSDLRQLADDGFTTLIDNRPDAEVPPSHQSDAMRKAAEEAGLTFVTNPVTHQGLDMEMVHAQSDALKDGKTLAYCASGTRSTIVWALGQASGNSADEIIAKAKAAGYDIAGMRPQLISLGAS